MSSKPAPRYLYQHYPDLVKTLPFTPLGDFPTPLEPLVSLAKATGLENLWVKRDDISAQDYGGNKIRKLEFLLADALARECKTVLTFGGLGSNHALATSLNCARLGIKCIAVLTPEPATDAVRRTLRYHQLLDTQLEIALRYADARAIADRVVATSEPSTVYEIPFGGSSWVGATGFVNAGLELAEQIKALNIAVPDIIYLACGTAGSTAGLALGLQLAGLHTRIEAVQVTPDSIHPQRLYTELFTETARQLHQLDKSIPLAELSQAPVNVRRDQLGAGYAIPTEAAKEAAALMLQTGQLPASLTYTAKAMAALIADARSGQLEGKNILYWNTYNSRPYPQLPDDDSWKKLPAELHALFSH